MAQKHSSRLVRALVDPACCDDHHSRYALRQDKAGSFYALQTQRTQAAAVTSTGPAGDRSRRAAGRAGGRTDTLHGIAHSDVEVGGQAPHDRLAVGAEAAGEGAHLLPVEELHRLPDERTEHLPPTHPGRARP